MFRRGVKACKICQSPEQQPVVDRMLGAGASDRSISRLASTKALKLGRLDIAKHRGHLAEEVKEE